MRFLRFAALATIAFTSLLVSSCLDGREEVWINADGSGRADFTYEIPAQAARLRGGVEGVDRLVAELLETVPSASHEVVQEDDRLRVRVKVAFQSPDDLKSITSSGTKTKNLASFDHMKGIFDVQRSFRTVDFTRTISPGKALPTIIIPPSELAGRKLTYIVHLPVVPTESTATKVENGGRTLIWERPLSGAVRQPIVVHFKAKIPIPPWLIAAAAAVLLLVVTAVVALVVRRRQRAGNSLR